jgi:hypothetical protein
MAQVNNILTDTPQIYRFDFVTDPDSPDVRDSLDQLFISVDKVNDVYSTETNLDRGLVRYTFDIIQNPDENPDLIHQIDQLIGTISYVPVTLSMDISRFSNNVNIGSMITGTRDIIKVLTQNLLHVEIVNVESLRKKNIVIFTPITSELNSLYENPKYLTDYYRSLNMEYLAGYQVLSDDPIVHYVLDDLYTKREYVPSDLNVISVDNILLVPVGTDENQEDHYTSIVNRIDTIITSKRQDGYFSYTLSLHNIGDVLLLEELGKLWETHIVYSKDMINIILKHNNIDFGTSPEQWFRYNLNLIKNGQFPEITLFGDWQFYMGGDYNEIYGKPWYRSILQYGALLAYRKLGEEDSFIESFTHMVRVNNDYSITLSLPTSSHVTTFRKYFHSVMDGYKGLEHQGENMWLVEPCKDLVEGVVKRYYVQVVDERSMPMVLTHKNRNGSEEEVLVFRSPAVGLHNPDSPFDFSQIDLDKVKDELILKLRDYYRICHDNMESVLLEKISDMSLDQLLSLVEIQERPNQPTYCYTKETILSLESPINPLTRRPFPDHVLVKAMMMEWGLRGLFNVGPLIGLYPDVPSKILVEPKVGVPIIDTVPINDIQRQVTGDIYSVAVGFSDGMVTDLFDIATSDQDELKRLVEELWSSGFFLNYWTSAVQKYSKDLVSFVVIINQPLLIYASDTKTDGIRAMDYLKESVNTFE